MRSHIIPKWMYSDLKDESHSFQAATGTYGNPKYIRRQNGATEYLFCKDCESKLSKWERVAANAFHQVKTTQHIESSKFKNIGMVKIEKVDYSSMKLFQLSLLWRYSISERPEFSTVKLGKYDEEIRQLLLSGTAGKSDLIPCLVYSVKKDSISNIEGIFSPKKSRIDSSTLYTLYISAWIFVYYVSPSIKPEASNLFSIMEDGIFVVGELFNANAKSFLNSTTGLGKILD